MSKSANGSASKPSPSGTPKSAKPRAKTTSPPSSSTKTRSRPTPRQQAQKEEYRRSIVNYPDPGDDLVNAIPSWTQPTMGKGGAGGNWDDVSTQYEYFLCSEASCKGGFCFRFLFRLNRVEGGHFVSFRREYHFTLSSLIYLATYNA